ncbi:cytochrome b N-terminal domain-containing protein, partial [Enterobacter hormaechei]
DQIGYWAVKIVTGVPEAIPLIGTPLVELLRGSASVGQSTLTRFYSLHTFILPLLTAVFMLMHFLMIDLKRKPYNYHHVYVPKIFTGLAHSRTHQAIST